MMDFDTLVETIKSDKKKAETDKKEAERLMNEADELLKQAKETSNKTIIAVTSEVMKNLEQSKKTTKKKTIEAKIKK